MKSSAWLASLIAILLGACALDPKRIETPPETRVIVQPAPPSETDWLLGHIAKVRRLDARDLAAERESARAQFQREKSDFNRVKYALMLVLTPGTPSATAAQDDLELIGLLEPLANGAAQSGSVADVEIRGLATLLYGIVSERRKVREQLRESQIKLALARKDDSRDAEARALRARVEELETRLNALKSIDRSVNRRADSVRK